MKKLQIYSRLILLLIIIVLSLLSSFLYLSQVIKAPNLIGLPYQQAYEILSNKNFKIVVKNPENHYGEQFVKVQYPKPGEWITKGEEIHLYLGLPQISRVPYLIGIKREEAVSVLNDLNLTFSFEKKPSFHPRNAIIQEDPPGGTTLSGTEKIHLTLSEGVIGLEAPDLIGKSVSEAREMVQPMGLTLLIKNDEQNPADQITIQDPKPGEALISKKIQVEAESTIVIPSLEGRNLKAALKLLERYGIKTGKISYQKTYAIPAGTVLDQDPDEGMEVRNDTKVNLLISGKS